MECNYGAGSTSPRLEQMPENLKLTTTVYISGLEGQALVDSGCKQTLVREDLLREAEAHSEGTMSLMCFHRDKKG